MDLNFPFGIYKPLISLTMHTIPHTEGAELEVYVTTSLSPDGIFWAQLSLVDPSYDAMAAELKLKFSESRDIMTPIFFNTGDLCAGMFSEDESWYRARITGARDGMVILIIVVYNV